MGDDDPTTVIKMLNGLTSTTDNFRRNSNVSLRLSGAGMNPPISLSIDGDRRLSSSTNKFKRTSGIPLNEGHSSSTTSFYVDDSTPPKRRKPSETRESSFLNTTDSEPAPSSPWEWRRLKGEVVSLRTRLSHQEASVQQLHKIRREMEEVFQKDKNMLEMQAELDKQTIKQLELRVESARKNAQEAREAQSQVENEMFEMKVKLEQKIASLSNENSTLNENTQRYTNSVDHTATSPMYNENHISDDMQMELEGKQKRITELEQKLKDTRLLEQEIEMQKLEIQNSRIKIDKLESERSLWEEGKAMLAGAARAHELERELNSAKEMIVSMRETVKGKLLIEEQMSNIMQRLEHTEKIEQQVANLEVKCNDLLLQLGEYESIGIGNGPDALKREICRLQQAEAVLTAEEGQLRSRVDSLQRENQGLQRKYDEVKKLTNEMTMSTERLNKFVSRLQKKVLLVTRERDNYRKIMDLYEKEMTTVEEKNIATDRIPALERALDDYRDMVTKLEAELDVPDLISWRDECQRLREEVERLKGELEHRALKGDFNCNSRILHFKMNPAAIAGQQAEDKMIALVREVEELRAAIQLGNLEPSVGSSSLQAQEIAQLTQTHEKKIARLKDAFKASSQEYRQACYQLFGWRVDRTKEGRYKLSSQYAESPDDFLFFHVGEGVDLLETAFSARLETLVERHLQIQHSVPMFLNAVQTELFSQLTTTQVMDIA